MDTTLETYIGDYRKFFLQILTNLDTLGISLNDYSLSHLGYKTSTIDEYERIRDGIKIFSKSILENKHNSREIAKLELLRPLKLNQKFDVSLIEIMPPKVGKSYENGLEHLGVVLGKNYMQFRSDHTELITGQQDQGPYCQPYYIRFADGLRVKFYEYSLKKAVELEGKVFSLLPHRNYLTTNHH